MEFQEVQRFLLSRREVAAWPLLEAYLSRRGSNPDLSLWAATEVACRACGGTSEDCLPGSAAIWCSLAARRLVDTLLDETASPTTEVLGVAGAANLALGLQALAQRCLDDGPPVLAARLQVVLADALLNLARGQDLDRHPIRDQADYWRVAEAKTPPLCRAALELGALLSGAEERFAARVGDLGWPLGLYLRLAEDFEKALARPADPGWRRPRHNFALATALELESGFEQLAAQAAEDGTTLAVAQELLIRGGTLAHGVEKMLSLVAELRAAGLALGFVAPQAFEQFLEPLLEPLVALLDRGGLDPCALPVGQMLFAGAADGGARFG